MSSKRKREYNQVKGSLFEVIIRLLLMKAGYMPIKPYGVRVRKSDGKVRGRGCWHDIDALGEYSFPLLYMYPIRLLAEAKCLKDPVGLPQVSNFVGALKDISENYFIADKISRDEMLRYKRYTDCGSFFSANGYTDDAQKFALAQGVFLVSYENNPILKRILDPMYELIYLLDISVAANQKTIFCRWIEKKLKNNLQKSYSSKKFIPDQNRRPFYQKFKQVHKNLNSIRTSVIAMVAGKNTKFQYPLHMLSYDIIPENLFIERGDHLFRIHYSRSPNGLIFRIVPREAEDVNFFVSLPSYIYTSYLSEGKMLDFKKHFLSRIELPAIIGGIRRILRLKLDEGWIEELEMRIRQ